MDNKYEKNPLKITDVTLRDAHQSIFATRMRTEDILSLAGEIGNLGFYSVEVWGGATFDVALRFLNEDPWDRLKQAKKIVPRTPLQMLLRGQNLVGYRHYPDDVVTAFVHHAAELGIDIFRVFDALNDERNMASAVKAIKESGKHAQLAICYSLTEPKMGGPVFNLDYYLRKFSILQDMGADSICIKDMAGLLAPDDAYSLVRELKKTIRVPLQLHSHCTSGMAGMAYLKAIEAGIDIVDTALAPMAERTSLPAVEPIVTALLQTSRDTGLALSRLIDMHEKLESIIHKYGNFLDHTKVSAIDSRVLLHQIPGGMISNLVNQLEHYSALDRLKEVLEEVPRVRKELGYPPLVTPMSQIVGAQAVNNVLLGRYKLVSTQLMEYCHGLYGQPPAIIDSQIQEIVLKHFKGGPKVITCRPADLLAPELEKAQEYVNSITDTAAIGDVLIYAVFPISGLRFLKDKYRNIRTLTKT